MSSDLSKLPADILRYLASENFDVRDLLRFCRVNKNVYAVIYDNEAVWWRLVERFLTAYPDNLQHLHTLKQHPRHLIYQYHDCYSFPLKCLCKAINNGYEKYIEQNYYKVMASAAFLHRDDYIEDIINDAAKSGRLDIFKYLVDKCIVNMYSFLVSAAMSRNLDLVKYILSYCSPNDWSYTQTMQDAFVYSLGVRDNLVIAEYLRERGASITIPHSDGETCETQALITSVDNVRYVLSHGSTLPSDSLAIVLCASGTSCQDKMDIIQLLIEELHFNPSDYPGLLTMLIDLDLAPYLIQHGAIVEYPGQLLDRAFRGKNEKFSTIPRRILPGYLL